MGALFHDALDELNRTVPAEDIGAWISTLPIADPIEREARRLAEFYWKLRWNEVSQDVYSVVRALKQDVEVPGLQPHPPSYPWLCSWKSKGDGRDASVRRIRLAILFLFLREHEDRIQHRRQHAEVPDEIRRLLEVIRDDDRDIEELLGDLENSARLDGCLERYHNLIADFLKFLESGALTDPIRGIIAGRELDVAEADIVRLVDPFPTAWDSPLSLDESTKVGKGLTRLDIEDVPSLNMKDLLAGDGSSLTPAEFLCARRFAREFMPSEEDWPHWLRSAGPPQTD